MIQPILRRKQTQSKAPKKLHVGQIVSQYLEYQLEGKPAIINTTYSTLYRLKQKTQLSLVTHIGHKYINHFLEMFFSLAQFELWAKVNSYFGAFCLYRKSFRVLDVAVIVACK